VTALSKESSAQVGLRYTFIGRIKAKPQPGAKTMRMVDQYTVDQPDGQQGRELGTFEHNKPILMNRTVPPGGYRAGKTYKDHRTKGANPRSSNAGVDRALEV
jgi:hypothetical protein